MDVVQVEDLLGRLKKVKKTGQDKWIACCPSHEDGSPSLTIKDADGKILIHCFAGCPVDDVLGAVGMELKDLFPPDMNSKSWRSEEKPVRIGTLRFTAIDALRCLAGEGSVVLLLACDLAEGKVLSPTEIDRLTTSCGRINAALTYLGDQDDIEKVTVI
jgi:hypothetical protein